MEILDSYGTVSKSPTNLVISVARNRAEVEYFVNKLRKHKEPFLFTREDRVYLTSEGERSEARFYNLYSSSKLFTGE